MKNIFVLPTDKPTNIYLSTNNKVFYSNVVKYRDYAKSQNIYITSDEKIKEGDWVYCNREGFEPVLKQKVNPMGVNNDPLMKKIILTTDQDLIKDGVQAIDDEFLEWFVNNPSCEEVEVVVENYEDNEWIGDDWGGEIYTFEYERYKIIIPKEEPKQELNFYEKLKEYFKTTPREKVLEDWNKSAHLDNVGPTVDEFIENSERERLENIFHEIDDKLVRYSTEESEFWHHYKVGVLDGLKWQQEQEKNKYNDEDLRTAYFSGIKSTGEGWNGEYANGNNPSIEEEFQEGFQEWFKQYKKK
jgi:hypothetical protein